MMKIKYSIMPTAFWYLQLFCKLCLTQGYDVTATAIRRYFAGTVPHFTHACPLMMIPHFYY